MSAITLERAKTNLEAWLAADEALATAQSYEIDTGGARRMLTRADAAEVRNHINYWSRWVNRLERGSGAPKVRLIVPRD